MVRLGFVHSSMKLLCSYDLRMIAVRRIVVSAVALLSSRVSHDDLFESTKCQHKTNVFFSKCRKLLGSRPMPRPTCIHWLTVWCVVRTGVRAACIAVAMRLFIRIGHFRGRCRRWRGIWLPFIWIGDDTVTGQYRFQYAGAGRCVAHKCGRIRRWRNRFSLIVRFGERYNCVGSRIFQHDHSAGGRCDDTTW